MKVSAALALLGCLLVVVQYASAPQEGGPPWNFAPLVLGILCLLAAAFLGLTLGASLYRAAVVIGLASSLVVASAVLVPWDRGSAGPRPSPTRSELIFDLGLALAAVSIGVGTLAILRDKRSTTPRDIR